LRQPIATAATRSNEHASSDLQLDAHSRFRRLWRNLALQDFIVLGFQSYMFVRALLSPDGADARVARIVTALLLSVALATLALTRGELIAPGFKRSSIYCIGLFASMLASYFALRWCLAALQARLLDPELYRIDRALFGETPAVLFDRFVTPASVEWFAFFYYGYFFLVAAHLLGTLIFDSGRRRYELLLGAAIVVSVGHASYTIVPGIGPHEYCAALFHHQLVGGAWWDRVESAVRSGGAMLDIFPSLHTALPTLFALHSFRHRQRRPYRQSWLLVSAAVVNIVIATLFLRWHYGIDVLAGLLLAFTAQRVAVFAWRREGERATQGRQEVWERLAPSHMQTQDFNYIAGLFMIHLGALLLAVTASWSSVAQP
jgi:hypothetical protein